MVAQTEEKWKRRFQEVSDEKEETVKKLAELQGKVRPTYSLRAGNSELKLPVLTVVCIQLQLQLYLLFDKRKIQNGRFPQIALASRGGKRQEKIG